MLTPHGHTFSVTTRGQKWSATWLVDGKDVCVTSAYGSARRATGRRKPEAVAKEALADLVETWAKASA